MYNNLIYIHTGFCMCVSLYSSSAAPPHLQHYSTKTAVTQTQALEIGFALNR